MSENWNFIPHPDAERFDRVTIDTIERWKESGLSGDEWRFSYVVEFWRHGEVAATLSAASVKDACLIAAAEYTRVKVGGPYMGDLSEVCCQPGCPNPWVVLMHPVKAYTKQGAALVRPYGDKDVRGFCEKHKDRGDCALDDAEQNYVVVEERFPPTWIEENP